MACFNRMSLTMFTLLGTLGMSTAAVATPLPTCPCSSNVSKSLGCDSASNYLGYDKSAHVPLLTLISTSTELSTVHPSAVIDTITATSTISQWHTATETFASYSTTISYIEIVSYSMLGVYTTTFLVPPSPITYTLKHTITSTMSAQDTPAGIHRRHSPSQVRDAVNVSSHGARPNSTSTGAFSMNNSSLSIVLLPLAPASLLDLPVWTDTMTVGGDSGATLTSTVSGSVITLTPAINISISSGAISTNNPITPVANVTYTQPLPSLVGSGVVTQMPTTRPEHKSPGATASLDYTTALVVVALVHIFFRG